MTPETLTHSLVPDAKAIKSNATLEMLAFCLKKVCLLGPIDRELRQEAAQAMIPHTVLPSHTVITQGETGEHLFVIETGTVEVVLKGATRPMAILKSGNSFGELALCTGQRRNATVRALTKTLLWSLDRKLYRVMLAQSSERKHTSIVKAIKDVPLLQSLSETQR